MTTPAAAAPPPPPPYVPPTPPARVLEAPLAVVGPQFCMPHPIDLAINTKHMSLTDTVTDINGNVVLRVREKFFSLHDKNTLLDSNGNPLVSMKQKLFSAHKRWQAFRGESFDPKDLLFTVKKSSILQRKTVLVVYLASNIAENAPDFTIKGSYFERSWTVYLGQTNTVLARMTMLETLQTVVYPNVDYAFIVALIVTLDEIKEDQEKGSTVVESLEVVTNIVNTFTN